MTTARTSTRSPAAPADRVVLAQATRAGDVGVDDASARPWLVHEALAVPLAAVAQESAVAEAVSVHELLLEWHAVASVLQGLTESPRTREEIRSRGCDVAELVLMSPVQPRQTFCTVGNYARQVVEAAIDAGDGSDGPGANGRRDAALMDVERRKRDGQPYICLTSSHRVSGPRGHLTLPVELETLDWEVEVAAVLGAEGTGAAAVAGYCLANDLTVRSRVLRSDVPTLGSDWVQSKGMPGSLPMGPWFVPTWQVPDVCALRLQLYLKQQAHAGRLCGRHDLRRRRADRLSRSAYRPGCWRRRLHRIACWIRGSPPALPATGRRSARQRGRARRAGDHMRGAVQCGRRLEQ